MNHTAATAIHQQSPAAIPDVTGALQRNCGCGAHTIGGAECGGCTKSRSALQRQLAIGGSHDPLELEADRMADQILAVPAHSAAGRALPRIQRVGSQRAGEAEMAPASVDRLRATAGRPLEPSLRQDMEQRFGHDFSRVRVHSGAAAEQCARDVKAAAYTVGHDIVFGATRFAPATLAGRRLIAHELTHVVQQSGSMSQTVQRDVEVKPAPGADNPPSLFTVFVADPRKRTDRWFAREQGKADAAAIRQGDALSIEERQLVNAKLSFFQGAAKEAYIQEVRPALVVATRHPIEKPAMYVGKLPDVPPAEQERIRLRRERTYRAFSKFQDYQLKEAYTSRLQRYLDEGLEANNYWDVEMIEQIIAERAPNAPWHAAARQEFLAKRAIKERSLAREKSLPTLSPYWQNQFGALAEQTAGWPGGLQTYARDLLWAWREKVAPYDSNEYLRDVVGPAAGDALVFDAIVNQFEAVLHDRDRAIQAECRAHPQGRLMKVWGDPCKPWFGEYATRGEDELRFLRLRMRLRRDEDRVPYRDIVYLLREYTAQVDALPTSMAGVHLQILQTWSTVQGSFALGFQPGKNVAALTSAATSTELAVSETQRALGAAGEIEGAQAATRAPALRPAVPEAPPLAPVELEAPRPAASAPKPLAPPPEPPPVASVAAERTPPTASRPPTTAPRLPPRIGRWLQKLYLAAGLAADELIPEHRDIAGTGVGKRPAPALIEKAPTAAVGQEVAPRPAPRAPAAKTASTPAVAPPATPPAAPTAATPTPAAPASPVAPRPTQGVNVRPGVGGGSGGPGGGGFTVRPAVPRFTSVMDAPDALALAAEIATTSPHLRELNRISHLAGVETRARALIGFSVGYLLATGINIQFVPVDGNRVRELGLTAGNWGTFNEAERTIYMRADVLEQRAAVREIGHEVAAAELYRVYGLPKNLIPRVLGLTMARRGDYLTHLIDLHLSEPD